MESELDGQSCAQALKGGKDLGYYSQIQTVLEDEHGRNNEKKLMSTFLHLIADSTWSLVSSTSCSQAIRKGNYVPALNKVQNAAYLGILVDLQSTMQTGLLEVILSMQ